MCCTHNVIRPERYMCLDVVPWCIMCQESAARSLLCANHPVGKHRWVSWPFAHAGKKQLRVLNLAENELEDKGACMVLAAVTGHQALETLDLTLNQVRRDPACFGTATPWHTAGYIQQAAYNTLPTATYSTP